MKGRHSFGSLRNFARKQLFHREIDLAAYCYGEPKRWGGLACPQFGDHRATATDSGGESVVRQGVLAKVCSKSVHGEVNVNVMHVHVKHNVNGIAWSAINLDAKM